MHEGQGVERVAGKIAFRAIANSRFTWKRGTKEIESLMRAKPGTPAGDRLDVLVTLVQAYEAKHYALDLPDPAEAIKLTMEQKGLTVKDLEPMIGRSNRLYEILNRTRPLTLKMI